MKKDLKPKKTIALFFLFGLLTILSGCSTLADAKAAKGTGSTQTYDQPYEVVWDAAIQAVKNSKLDLVSDDKNEGLILAQNGISAFSYGENVAIFIEEIEKDKKTRVEIVNKRAMSTNVFAADWEGHLLYDLHEIINTN